MHTIKNMAHNNIRHAYICAILFTVQLSASYLYAAQYQAANAISDWKTVNSTTISFFSKKHAERIVSLSPAATETLCAVGAYKQIAARTDMCDYPEEVKQLPSTGGFDGKTLSIEKIISYQPDLVYITYGMHDYLAGQLAAYGIHIYISNASSVHDVLNEIGDIGMITGHTAEASDVQKHITDVIAQVRTKIAGRDSPSVYWEIWNSPFMSAGKTSFMDSIIEAAGGKNIFSDIHQAYPLVSQESIIKRQPQIIIIPDMEKETIASVSRRSGWDSIPAVRNNRIIFINADITARPGPRIAQAVLILAHAFYPDADMSSIR